MVREQRSLRSFVRAHRLAIRLGAAAAVVLLGVVSWRAIASSQPSQPIQRASNRSDTPACTYADATFCSTEARYRTLVATQAASDILESQVVTPHICSGQTADDQYCNGISSGLTIPLYTIVDNGQPRLFTRNSGITYLRSFFAANGTPVYQATDPDSASDAIVMVFTSRTKARLLLHFTKANGGWQFTHPETATATTS